jgi:beta-glucosidase-like glycosyl hydrolase
MNTPREAPAQQAREAADRALHAALSLDDKVRLLTGADNWRTCALPAIGLRVMVVSDGPAGVRGVTMDERNPASSLPCPSALGATWDPALVQALASALGAEARSKGVDVLLAPTINVRPGRDGRARQHRAADRTGGGPGLPGSARRASSSSASAGHRPTCPCTCGSGHHDPERPGWRPWPRRTSG